MKYRKKPVVIEATQANTIADAINAGAVGYGRGHHPENGGIAFIETLEGRMTVQLGDWIITGVKGEKYPCNPDIFAATYEPA